MAVPGAAVCRNTMSLRYRIHPSVGFARFGDAEGETSSVGPEIPGRLAVGARLSLRSQGRLRRQAARFRVFEYDSRSNLPPKEVYVNGVIRHIEWTIRLACRKPLGWRLGSRGLAAPLLRNGHLTDPAEREARLCLSPPPLVVKGLSRENFRTIDDLPGLGSVLVDPTGKLSVTPGDGRAWTRVDVPLGDGLDNDHWFDGQADGVVTAALHFHNGEVRQAQAAWVVFAPPRYAPGVRCPVTLYDVLFDQAVRLYGYRPALFDSGEFCPDYRPSFQREIAPLLKAVEQRCSVIQCSGGRVRWDLAALSRRSTGRQSRSPAGVLARFESQAEPEGDTQKVRVTRTQYFLLSQWAAGQFVEDWLGDVTNEESTVTAAGLDQAALEDCVGSPLQPGYEVSDLVCDPRVVQPRDPFRFRLTEWADDPYGLRPGMATMDLPLPWQSGLFQAARFGWPSHRPLHVRTTPGRVVRWDRGVTSAEQMLTAWSELGAVRAFPGVSGPLIESDRTLD